MFCGLGVKAGRLITGGLVGCLCRRVLEQVTTLPSMNVSDCVVVVVVGADLQLVGTRPAVVAHVALYVGMYTATRMNEWLQCELFEKCVRNPNNHRRYYHLPCASRVKLTLWESWTLWNLQYLFKFSFSQCCWHCEKSQNGSREQKRAKQALCDRLLFTACSRLARITGSISLS